MLDYAERFYQRQFLTRRKSNQVLDRLEQLMNAYCGDEALYSQGLPTVQYISDQLNIPQSYLHGLLKTLMGQSTQQYIHKKFDKAKEKRSTTSLSVSEIDYELGFEHPQSFSKLFKSKTNQSPPAFRGGI